MYYSAYDLQCGCYFHTGRNSICYIDCVIAIWQYMTEDWEDKEILEIPILEVLNFSGVEIVKHREKMED